jgi:hypothetical protein
MRKRKSQKSFYQSAIKTRVLGQIVQRTGDSAASTELDPGEEVTYIITLTSDYGIRLFDVPDIALFEDSVAAANRIHGGANVNGSEYQVIGPWKDWLLTDGINQKTAVYIRNSRAATATVSINVSANSDDCMELADTTFTDAGCQVGENAGIYDLGLRFNSVAIPQGVTINSASIDFRGALGRGPLGNTVKTKIKGVDEDDTAAWSSGSRPSQRAKTTANVDWDFTIVEPATISPAAPMSSGDFKAVVEEIVGRSGWVSGNDMGIVVEDDGSTVGDFFSFEYYENDPTETAQLNVEYQVPANDVLIRAAGRFISNRKEYA